MAEIIRLMDVDKDKIVIGHAIENESEFVFSIFNSRDFSEVQLTTEQVKEMITALSAALPDD